MKGGQISENCTIPEYLYRILSYLSWLPGEFHNNKLVNGQDAGPGY
jgi:hypothetical protein